MRLLFSILSYAFKLLLALIAFTFTAIEFPVTLRDLLAEVNDIRDQVSPLFSQDNYRAAAEIALWPNLIVFAGFAVAVHFAMDLLRLIFSGGRYPRETEADEPPVSA